MKEIKVGYYYRNKINGLTCKVIQIDTDFVFYSAIRYPSFPVFCSKDTFLNKYRPINSKLEKLLYNIE